MGPEGPASINYRYLPPHLKEFERIAPGVKRDFAVLGGLSIVSNAGRQRAIAIGKPISTEISPRTDGG